MFFICSAALGGHLETISAATRSPRTKPLCLEKHMKPLPQKSPTWQLLVYDALKRFCPECDEGEYPADELGASVDGSVQSALSSVDFRTLRNTGISLSEITVAALVARAFTDTGGFDRVLNQGALSVLRGQFNRGHLTWALRWLVPDDVEVHWSYRETSPRALRVLAVENLDAKKRGFAPGVYDDLTNIADPVILLAENDDELPIAFQVLDVHEVVVKPLDREILSLVIQIWFSDLPIGQVDAIARKLPDLSALDLVHLDELLLAFRKSDPNGLPAAMVRFLALSAGPEQKQKPRPPRSVVPLSKIVGLGRAKQDAIDCVEALCEWKAGTLPWSEVPRGLLLSGPSGTGKTELARAMAGEADINLVSASYNEWQKAGSLSYFLEAMDKSFKEAKRSAPSILFIDELDAFYTRSEVQGSGRNDSYDIKAIAALLEQLDGIIDREGVIVMAACNHIQFVDAAIRRSGRFDSIVEIGLPDLEALRVIFAQHLGQRSEAIDIASCAAAALGRSGADCAAAIRMAGTIARRKRRAMATEDILAALEGDVPPLTAEEWHRIAIHECGHAIVAVATGTCRVEFIRIGASGGECKINGKPELQTAAQLHQLRCIDLAGRAAEHLIFGDVTTGSGGSVGSDLARATRSAADQVVSFGLGALGPVWVAPVGTAIALNEAINGHLPEISELLHAAEQDSMRILREHRTLLTAMAEVLVRARILHGEVLEAFLSRVAAGQKIG